MVSKNILTRKRKRNEAEWTRCQRKTSHLSGEEHKDSTGKIKTKRVPKEMLPGHDKCKFNCKTISLEDRLILCNSFWGLKDYIRDYIIKCIRQENIKRRKTNRKTTTQREFSNHYSFLLREEKIIVCSDFFHKTLNISTKMSRLAMERRTETGEFAGKDNRGLNPPANKIPDDIRQKIIDHINSFNAVESHYCRSNTNRKFLKVVSQLGKCTNFSRNR